jgi:hypothetical protein
MKYLLLYNFQVDDGHLPEPGLEFMLPFLLGIKYGIKEFKSPSFTTSARELLKVSPT